MSKKEGEILRKAIRDAGMTVQQFAEMMGYSGRTTLNYQFLKDRLDFEIKEKAAEILNTDVQTLFERMTNDQGADSEKEALRDLVETQKSLIRYQNEFITAQLIRNEAFESVILARMAEIEIATVPSRKGATLDAVLDEAESDVQEKIREIRDRLKLPS
ncbi:hypothetical protein FHW36_10646 [Chitinophaga polysaccharea]|uniref:Uncharacterized protein n=1 Tax=Chitinophaga polysaccharea TaxID=1293035 RepID=A0A561PL32_9BACT|nr:helix-turn-helix transcriptional regulator [Chitinophaga polysaccharea]TWF38825.1 hypothetical protein FHW36_10646 [Chitinophaga polysaccharea]